MKKVTLLILLTFALSAYNNLASAKELSLLPAGNVNPADTASNEDSKTPQTCDQTAIEVTAQLQKLRALLVAQMLSMAQMQAQADMANSDILTGKDNKGY